MSKKTVNYSVEDIAVLEAGYDPEANQEERDSQVASLASELGRGKQSIVAKLVNLGVYVKKVHTKKDGSAVVKKDDRVSALAERMGVAPELLDSLAKANVSVIKMVEELLDSKQILERNLESVTEAAHSAGIDV